METTIRINNIFESVSGECGLFRQGSWTTFIRLQGCNLKCSYCDTLQSQHPKHGMDMTLSKVAEEVEGLGNDQVLITGGEPLVQKEKLEELIEDMDPCTISVETNGSIIPPENLYIACWIVDYKLPSSGYSDSMMSMDDFAQLQKGSWIKFVCLTRYDYDTAVGIWRHLTAERTGLNYAMSAGGPLKHNELFQWMKEDHLKDILLNVQLHKVAELQES